jgi:hypothetical protein
MYQIADPNSSPTSSVDASQSFVEPDWAHSDETGAWVTTTSLRQVDTWLFGGPGSRGVPMTAVYPSRPVDPGA